MKRKKQPRKKELSLTRIKKKIDTVFSRRIRKKGYCEKCGTTNVKSLQCAHIFSRSHMSTRWDEDNALCLCVRCHIYWAHREPVEFTEWVRNYLGESRFQELRKQALTPRGFERWELEQLLSLWEE